MAQKWEYLRKQINHEGKSAGDDLNNIGLLGWELVAVMTMGGYFALYIFKRPKN